MNKTIDLSKGKWRVRFDPSQYETVARAALESGATGYDGWGDISLPRYACQAIALYFQEGVFTYLTAGSESFWGASESSADSTEVFFYDGKFWTEPESVPSLPAGLQPRAEWLRDRANALTDAVRVLLCRRMPVPVALRAELNQLLIDLQN